MQACRFSGSRTAAASCKDFSVGGTSHGRPHSPLNFAQRLSKSFTMLRILKTSAFGLPDVLPIISRLTGIPTRFCARKPFTVTPGRNWKFSARYLRKPFRWWKSAAWIPDTSLQHFTTLPGTSSQILSWHFQKPPSKIRQTRRQRRFWLLWDHTSLECQAARFHLFSGSTADAGSCHTPAAETGFSQGTSTAGAGLSGLWADFNAVLNVWQGQRAFGGHNFWTGIPTR